MLGVREVLLFGCLWCCCKINAVVCACVRVSE